MSALIRQTYHQNQKQYVGNPKQLVIDAAKKNRLVKGSGSTAQIITYNPLDKSLYSTQLGNNQFFMILRKDGMKY